MKYCLLSLEIIQISMKRAIEFIKKLWKYNLKVIFSISRFIFEIINPIESNKLIAYIPLKKLKQPLL